MLRAVNNPTLVLIAPGQPRTTFPLAGGVTTIGRSQIAAIRKLRKQK